MNYETQITRANVHDYNKIMKELYRAIKGYKDEWEKDQFDLSLGHKYRTKIFECYGQLESMGKP